MNEFTIKKSAYIDIYNEWSDWRSAVDIISNTKEKNIVELGLGLGTKYLLERFKYVYSFEVVNNNEWYSKSVDDYKGFVNWSSQFYFMHYFGLDEADKKLLDSQGDVRDTSVLVKYFKYLEDFIGPALDTMDVALIDPGFHFLVENVRFFDKPEQVLEAMRNAEYNELRSTVYLKNSDVSLLSFNGLGAKDGSIELLHHTSDRLILKVKNPRDSVLIVTNNFNPYWKATIDGMDTKVFPADHTFQGIYISGGEHKIILEYSPPYAIHLGEWAWGSATR